MFIAIKKRRSHLQDNYYRKRMNKVIINTIISLTMRVVEIKIILSKIKL
jgi:hypothetical protein